MEAGNALLDQVGTKSKRLSHLLADTLNRAATLQRVFSSTSLDVCLHEDDRLVALHSGEILFETAVAIREILWRLRDIARDLSLQASSLEPHEAEMLHALIALLDGEGDRSQPQPQAA